MQTRRSFVATLSASALSYSRILGANDRISLGYIGVGARGLELVTMFDRLKDKHNLETTAICDLWTVNRDIAVKQTEKTYGRRPRAFQNLEDLLALRDVDAVVISTADHQHASHLMSAMAAGKDAYCEKPMANDLASAKAVRDAFLKTNRIVSIGTQHRSEPYQIETKKVIDSGALGDISKVEIVWNYNGPRWRGRPQAAQIREQDTNWRKWLLDKPYRPFDPRLYFEFRLYREFSTGIGDQWMSHGFDLLNYFLEDRFPNSAVAMGGVYAWRDGRENPDTFHTLMEYPKGFLLSYSVSFGNDSPSFSRIMGKKATLINTGGEGSPHWTLVEEGGNYLENPNLKRAQRFVTLPGESKPGPAAILDADPTHLVDWLDCLRSRRQPHATVADGLASSVPVIMAAQAYWEGRRVYWDPVAEQIVNQPSEARK
jgi:predicted dehydrogenase